MKFDIILACDSNGCIGKGNSLPWSIEDDLKFFFKKTSDVDLPHYHNVVIMGRKTFESMNSIPLKNRINIILSKDRMHQEHSNVLYAKSLHHALTITLTLSNINNIFIIGGIQLYNEALKHPASRYIYLTEIHEKYDGDHFINLSNLYNSYRLIKYINYTAFDSLNNKDVSLTYNKYISKFYYNYIPE